MSQDPNFYRSAGWSAERAREELAASRRKPGDMEIWRNKRHPLHKIYLERRKFLYQVIAGEPAPKGSTPSPWPKASFAERVHELQQDPAYRNRRDPGHAAAVQKMLKLHEEKFPEAAAAPEGGSR